MKTCKRCGYSSDDLTMFRKDKRQRDGRASLCKECSCKESAEHRRIIAKAIYDSKLGKPCEVCGGFFPPVALDYHHKDPSLKSFGIGEGTGRARPLELIFKEIAKCMLICSNCHRILHYEEELNGYKTDTHED